ncbi:MAG: peptidylprolyl isomerase [Bacteroidales bacterium]|nr:peptidylprolyl isomerase [Bacteroidales bacterium]
MRSSFFARLAAIAIFSFLTAQVFAQSKLDKSVLMTIGGKPVTVKEFTDIYNKNNLKDDVIEKKSVDEYIDLFVNYRIKVMEAYDMKLDTSAKFKKELNGYRKQLAKPYFTNDEVSEELVEEAYQRKTKDIRASHILIKCDKHALPADTLKAYNKAMDIRKKALAGADFGELAMTYSQDPSARDQKATATTPERRGNRGDLGYFTVFDMVYPFETGAYNTPEGEISMPVRSDFGYHIIKVTSKTDALGVVNAAHIFLKLEPGASEEEIQAMKLKADNIYKEIMDSDGKGWNDAVANYSDDRASISRYGALSPFTVSRIVPEFVETVKKLKPGEIAAPIRTSFGFHIIKLLGVSGIDTFEKERQAIAERVEKDMRSKKTEEVVIQQIKKDYGFKNNDKNIEKFMSSVDSTILLGNFVPAKNVKLSNTLFTIGKKSCTVSDFVDYIQTKQTPQRYASAQAYAYQLFDAFQGKEILEYADEHLEEKYPDFKLLVQEYNDGILLFDLMDKEVWSKAVKDTVGLREYYEKNATKYMWNDRVKACVITVNKPESLPKVKEFLDQGVPFDSLRAVLTRNQVNNVTVRNGFYQRGDNPFVDQTKWKANIRNEISSTVDNTTVIVNIIEVRKPEQKTLGEARGLVTSDYQTELEEKWLERLRKKYPVVINEKVLDKVRALYQ